MNHIMLVTGASRGIGAAISRRAAQAGWDVAINYAGRADKAAEVAADVEAAGQRALCVKADVGDSDAVATMFTEIDKNLGAVTALINNAGIVEKMTMAELDPARLTHMMQVNVMGCLYCVHEAVKRMGRSSGGTGRRYRQHIVARGGHRRHGRFDRVRGDQGRGRQHDTWSSQGTGVRRHPRCRDPARPDPLRYSRPKWRARGRGKDGRNRSAVGTGRRARGDRGLAVWLCGNEASYVTGALFDVGGGR